MVSLRPRRPAHEPSRPLAASGLFVPAYYVAQAGRGFDSDDEAVEHYLSTGRSLGLLPNPVHDFDRVDLPTDAPDIVRRSSTWPVREWFDRRGYLRLLPASGTHDGGPAGHFLQAQATGGTAFGLSHPAGHMCSSSEVLRIASERAKHLQTILKADAFDRPLYEAQVGRTFASDTAAVWHYLERGEDLGLSPATTYVPPADSAHDLGDAVSRFAREVRRGQLTNPAPPPARARMLAELARRVMPCTAASAPWSPPAPPLAPPQALTVSLLARASDLSREGVRNIASLTRQSHEAWELVVALPPRASGRVRGRVGRLADADARVRVVEVDDALASTEVLVDVADGDVIGWWDGSRLHPDLLTQGLATLTGAGSQVASAGVVCGDALDDLDPLRLVDPPAGDTATLLAAPPRGVRGVLARREIAGLGPDPLDGAASGWGWLLNASARETIASIPLIGAAGPAEHLDPLTVSRSIGTHALRSPATRRPGTTSVVVTGVDRPDTLVETIRVAADDGATAVVIVDRTDLVVPLITALAAIGVDLDAVTLEHLRMPGTLGLATQRGIDAATGDICVLLSPSIVLVPGALQRLTSALVDGVVAASAVVLTDDDTIASAGLVTDGNRSTPRRLLAGHPAADIPALEDVRFAAAEGHALAVRAATMVEHEVDPGLDEWAVVDATARAASDARVRIATEVRLRLDRPDLPPLRAAEAPWTPMRACPPTDLLDASTGLTTIGWSGAPVLVRRPRLVTEGPARGLPSLRWALKLPTPRGPRGPLWGDTFFADDLARSLRRLGQDVVIDRRTSHHRASGHLDDVVLSLRGLVPYRPQPGVTSILWVISHPDLVDPAELRDVDLAYAASVPWSRHASEASGRPVSLLLQAADTSRFFPDGSAREGIVFVGRPRRGGRKVVVDAIAAGATVELYGEGWAEVVDPRHVRGEFVPNDQLPALYRRARIVLNDHWPDMAAEGFWSNRTFEAIASGALVVSDEVAGGNDLFGGFVRGYADVDELAALLAPDAADWPVDDAPPALQHSFDARAHTLLADVLHHRGVAHHLDDGAP